MGPTYHAPHAQDTQMNIHDNNTTEEDDKEDTDPPPPPRRYPLLESWREVNYKGMM